MKVVVHIGTEKTGTTTIQTLLDRNREILSEEGFHVLRCAGKINHRALPSYCVRVNRDDDYLRNNSIDSEEKREHFRDKIKQAVETEISQLEPGIHTVLISSEHFHSLLSHNDEIERLHDLLQPFFTEMRILVYLREQVGTALSRFSTAIKSGRTPDLQKFIKQCTTNNAFYNYDILLKKWARVFGESQIDAAIFSREYFVENDLLSDFLSRLDSSLIGKLDVEFDIENESLTALGQTVGRAINMAFPAFEAGIGVNPLRARLMKLNARHFRGRASAIDAVTRESIQNEFAASNEEVRKRYFPQRKTLFLQQSAMSQDPGAEPDLASALSEMFKLILDDNNVVPQRYVDIFRNVAIKLEQDHLEKSYEMMNLAYRMRPDGPLIKAKREEYLARLEALKPEIQPSEADDGNK